MKDDTIYRQAAIIQLSHNKSGNEDSDIVVQRDIETIKALPSIEPERKKGKWIRITHGTTPEKYMCPFCHRTIEEYESEALLSMRYPFCHCGADMRGEQK